MNAKDVVSAPVVPVLIATKHFALAVFSGIIILVLVLIAISSVVWACNAGVMWGGVVFLTVCALKLGTLHLVSGILGHGRASIGG